VFIIFVYLEKGKDKSTNFFDSIKTKYSSFFDIFTGKVTTTTSATDTDSDVTNKKNNAKNDTKNDTKNENETTDGKKAATSVGGTPLSNAIPHADVSQNNAMNKALNKTTAQKNIGQSHDYVADDSTSSIQKTQSKHGYCYIGKEKGVRTCMRVSEDDTCMSGEIFPTSEICINPNLRL